MSYILEALKKSDRERKQGEIPGLQSDHGLRSGQGKREAKVPFWKWLLVCILFVLSALVLYWSMQRNSMAMQEKISALEKSVVQLKEQPFSVVAHPPAAREEAVLQPFVVEAADPSAAIEPPVVKEESVSQPLVMETGDDKGVVAENPQRPVIEERTVIRAVDIPRKAQQNVVVSPPKSLAQEVAAEAAETLPLVQDLPSSVQKSLPPLKLAGHVYAKEAAKRMIIINNRICREGDLVENQLVLEQIVWGGVVLRYQEIRFRMKL